MAAARRRLERLERHVTALRGPALLRPEPAARTEYVASPPLPGMEALPLPPATRDLEQAKADMSTHGVCIVECVCSFVDPPFRLRS